MLVLGRVAPDRPAAENNVRQTRMTKTVFVVLLALVGCSATPEGQRVELLGGRVDFVAPAEWRMHVVATSLTSSEVWLMIPHEDETHGPRVVARASVEAGQPDLGEWSEARLGDARTIEFVRSTARRREIRTESAFHGIPFSVHHVFLRRGEVYVQFVAAFASEDVTQAWYRDFPVQWENLCSSMAIHSSGH